MWEMALTDLTGSHAEAGSVSYMSAFATCRYLKADYRILVKAPGQPISMTWLHYAIPGAVCLVIFAVVIPATYFLILWFLRLRLKVRRPPDTSANMI